MRFQRDLEIQAVGLLDGVAQMVVGRIPFQVDMWVVEGVLICKRIQGYPICPNLVLKVVEEIPCAP